MRLIDADAIRIKPEFMQNICGMAMIRAEDLARILMEQPTVGSQEPIEPEIESVSCRCGACGEYLMSAKQVDVPINRQKVRFCNYCGREVKW